jgi:hypothetical protein
LSKSVTILWHVDPLLDNDRGISKNTAAVTPTASRTSMFKRKQLERVTQEQCFYAVRARDVINRTVNAVEWNELVVGQSQAGKNVSTEAEDVVGIRHQATTGEVTAD